MNGSSLPMPTAGGRTAVLQSVAASALQHATQVATATNWPKEAAWPSELHEHATYLSRYLREAPKSIDNAKEQPVPAFLVKITIMGMLSLILKQQNAPNVNKLHDTLTSIQINAKHAADLNMKNFDEMKTVLTAELNNTKAAIQQFATNIQENNDTLEETKLAANEARNASTATRDATRNIERTVLKAPNGAQGLPTYAAVAGKGVVDASRHNTLNINTLSTQAQREVVVNIRDPFTIALLRAMNSRELKAHIDRAIAQSGNEHISSIKIASSNQLKSGDLSIKTTTTKDTEALKQFAEDWTHKIGNGANARIPTYGVLAHGIRTSTMDMDKANAIKTEVLQENRPFIPSAEIKYIGWLSRASIKKSASSMVIEFTTAEDANKIIDEGLIWQGQLFQCERYDRQCRLKQCFNWQKYGHIGTQCKTTTACGYCAQEHKSRDCPFKSDNSVPRKCAACHWNHEAWHSQCAVRQEEQSKIKVAYNTRQHYHPIAERTADFSRPRGIGEERTPAIRRRRLALNLSEASGQASMDYSQTRKIQKRTNTGATDSTPVRPSSHGDGGEHLTAQKPQRGAIPSRRALEATQTNIQPHSSNSQPTEIDIES